MFKQAKLDNGIQIIGETMPSQDVVSIGFWFNVGSADESKERNGYSHIIEHMLFKGSKNYNAFDIVKKIEGVGGNFNAFTSRHFTTFYINILSSHIDRAMDILIDIIESSAFDEQELKREKQVIIEEIRQSNDIPEEVLAQEIFKRLYKGSGLAMPIAGTISSVKNASRNGIIEHYQDSFGADNLLVSIAGKFDFDYVQQRLSKAEIPKCKNKNAEKDSSEKMTFTNVGIENESLNQVYFCLVNKGFKAGDRANYPLTIINNILGGASSSRLFQSIREKHGLCYNIYSYKSSYKNSGTFEINGATSLNRLNKALELIYKEIKNLIDFHLSEEEISDAKAMYKGALAFNKNSTDFIMSKNARYHLYRNEYLSVKQMYSRISKVKKDDIKEVLEEVYGSKDFFLAAIGPKGTKDRLKKSYAQIKSIF